MRIRLSSRFSKLLSPAAIIPPHTSGGIPRQNSIAGKKGQIPETALVHFVAHSAESILGQDQSSFADVFFTARSNARRSYDGLI
jgi:hypothetical protein